MGATCFTLVFFYIYIYLFFIFILFFCGMLRKVCSVSCCKLVPDCWFVVALQLMLVHAPLFYRSQTNMVY